MARVRSTARVDHEGDETEATETVPILEAMKRSGLVTPEDIPTAKAEDIPATCWGPSSSEGPQKHDLTMFSKWIM
jgi:hypothetical protein